MTENLSTVAPGYKDEVAGALAYMLRCSKQVAVYLISVGEAECMVRMAFEGGLPAMAAAEHALDYYRSNHAS